MVTKAASKDVEVLEPTPEGIKLSTGDFVNIKPLKTRGLFKLLKIVTSGLGDLIAAVSLSDDEEEFAGQMIGMIIAAVPEAEDESMEFIRAMVEPTGLIPKPKTNADKARNEALELSLDEALEDPEPIDTFAIITALVEAEAENMMSLGKQVQAMFKMNVAQAKVNSSSSKS